MSTTDSRGIVSLQSPYSVPETVDHLADALQSHGMRIFARIDQQAAARESSAEMRPMELLLFGNPAAGTPLMQTHPSLAIDLPLKALIWEDPDGIVRVSYNSSDYLQQRHGLPTPPFAAVGNLIEAAVRRDEAP